MKSFFKNAADEIARRRIDQIEMEDRKSVV